MPDLNLSQLTEQLLQKIRILYLPDLHAQRRTKLSNGDISHETAATRYPCNCKIGMQLKKV